MADRPRNDGAGQVTRVQLGSVAVATIGGLVFRLAQMPLAWIMGAMAACVIATLAGRRIETPPVLATPAIALIGAMLGSSFVPSSLQGIGGWWAPLLGLAAFVALSTVAGYGYFRAVARMDRPTAFFCAAPGGLLDMVLVGVAKGGAAQPIALTHAARILVMVMILPPVLGQLTGAPINPGAARGAAAGFGLADAGWLVVACVAGARIGRWLRFPAAALVGPMTVSAGLHLSGVSGFILPPVLMIGAQIVAGIIIGQQFTGASVRAILRIMALSVGGTAILLAMSLAVARIVLPWAQVEQAGLVLAYAPGGLTEMGLLAIAAGIEVPFVITHHVIRLFAVLLVASPVFGWLVARD